MIAQFVHGVDAPNFLVIAMGDNDEAFHAICNALENLIPAHTIRAAVTPKADHH